MNDVPGPSVGIDWMRVVDELVHEFEATWVRSANFSIEEFLPRIDAVAAEKGWDPAALRTRVIAALIPVEMEMRLKLGELVSVGGYRQRFSAWISEVEDAWGRLYGQSELMTVSGNGSDSKIASGMTIEPTAASADSIPTRLGRFTEIFQIGEGSFGLVCRAVDTLTGEAVALKFPRRAALADPRTRQAFIDEASQAQQLDHPGIISTHQLEAIEGRLVLVLQLIEGVTLKEAFLESWEPDAIAQATAQIADALAYAHRQGVVHRDIKPANLLIDTEHRTYVADFGLALLESRQLDAPDARCGTPPYMSPEQVIGKTVNLDGRTDIWSLGVVLYEWLSGRRPFVGRSREAIFEQIKTRDPRPLRAMDPDLPPELERICFKCLERRPGDRYLTADDLADDLRNWKRQGVEISVPRGTAPAGEGRVARGLRAFGPEDADYFLGLLPGARHRDGIPASIRFWEQRIREPVLPEHRIPIGVLFGPSGSGKSSFVKAGLLPCLGDAVEVVYIESTQADTEVRLLKALRQRFPELTEESSLVEMFSAIAEQRVGNGGKKILVVLDQFEQFLSRGDDYGMSQLVDALCHCEGKRLQCLLLVRDDFWLAMSRLADAVDLDLREGSNLQNIDLFDKAHAVKVLTLLGQAYGQLPPGQPSEAEERFLQQAVDQLATEQHVICVRLALFAEMFKSRPWTTEELDAVGGASGIGVRYLEDTFGAAGRAAHRSVGKPARQILEALLPAHGTDIRGAMKSATELQRAAGLESNPDFFRHVHQILDRDLKLVTQTDPDTADPTRNPGKDPPAGSESWFQLTHDYLVRSIREWLAIELRATRRGRARLRVQELARMQNSDGSFKVIPTPLQWLGWRLLVPSANLSRAEQAVMAAGQRNFIQRTSLALAVLFALGFTGWLFARQLSMKRTMAALETAPWDAIPGLIDQLEGTPAAATQIADQINQLDPESDFDKRRRWNLALYALNGEGIEASALIDSALRPTCSPEELAATCRVLGERNEPGVVAQLEKVLGDPFEDARVRFRAGCCRMELSSEAFDWAPHAIDMMSSLIEEPREAVSRWIDILNSQGAAFLPAAVDLLATSNDSKQAAALSLACQQWVPFAEQAELFARMVDQANPVTFDLMMDDLERLPPAEIEALRRAVDGRLQAARRRDDWASASRLTIATFRLGAPAELLAAMVDPDPRWRLSSLQQIEPDYVDRADLRTLYETQKRQGALTDPTMRRAVLRAIARYSLELNEPEARQLAWLVGDLEEAIVNDPDPGCFAAAWSAHTRLAPDSRTLGDLLTERRTRQQALWEQGQWPDVYIDHRGQAFVHLASGTSDSRRLYVAATETTNAEIVALLTAAGRENLLGPARSAPPRWPFDIDRNFAAVEAYLELLSNASDAPPESRPPEPKGSGPFTYRLPTEGEWDSLWNAPERRGIEAIDSNGLKSLFAWSRENSGGQLQPVAGKLPSEEGLFDVEGNIAEICSVVDESAPYLQRGGSALFLPRERGIAQFYPHNASGLEGIRLVLEIRSGPPVNSSRD